MATSKLQPSAQLWETYKYAIQANSSGVATLNFSACIDGGIMVISYHADRNVSYFGGVIVAAMGFFLPVIADTNHNNPSGSNAVLTGTAPTATFTITAPTLPNCKYDVRVTYLGINYD